MKRVLSVAVIGLAVLGLQSASAGEGAKELAIATVHAGMAADAADMKMVHAHLQHVVNCLAGPMGADYNGAAGDPCKGQGDGAIADSAISKRMSLEAVLQTAKMGAAEPDLDKAKADAIAVKAALGREAM